MKDGNKITIPTEFWSMGRRYETEIRGNLLEEQDCIGRHLATKCLILLEPPGENIPKDAVEETFYHELMHAMFTGIGRSDLAEDEQLVEMMGRILYQFEVTRTGDIGLY